MVKKILLILGYLFTSQAFADSTGGEITFTGSIIEEANCQVITVHDTLEIDCFNNGQAVATSEILSHSQLEFLNKENNQAVMQLSYH